MKLETIYPKIEDKYGKWTIIEIIPGGRVKVQCECGEIVTKRFYDLKMGTSKQCLKCRYGTTIATNKQKPKHWTVVETGMKFGHWTITDKEEFIKFCELVTTNHKNSQELITRELFRNY